MTEKLLNETAATLDKLAGLGVGHALCATENNAWLFLDYLRQLHWDGGELGELARQRLFHFATAAVNRLNALTDEHPAIFRVVAETQESWPVLINQTGESVKLAEERCRGLNVGAKSGLNVVPKPGRGKKLSPLTTPSNREVLRLNTHIKEILGVAATGRLYEANIPWLEAARDLPTVFDGNSWEAWFAVGWEMLVHENGGHPEDRPDLRELGKTRVSHAARQKVQTSGTAGSEAARVRAKIKDALKEAYRRVADLPREG